MNEWWNGMEAFDKVVWIIAIASSVIFIVQMILTFAGMDSHGDAGGDIPHDTGHDMEGPFQLFTLRNFINFFLGFSWGVISFRSVIGSIPLLVLVGALFGVALVAAVMYMFYAMSKMTESGTMNMVNALNKTAEVYLTIPGSRKGHGKVHIQIQGALRELDAMTDGEAIPTGRVVKVTELINNKILLVQEI